MKIRYERISNKMNAFEHVDAMEIKEKKNEK
jgi:hypothetical protein